MGRGCVLTDSHLHMCEEGFPGDYRDFGSLSLAVSCTADPAEWNPCIASGDAHTVRSFGVHPWNSDIWHIDVRSRLRSVLEGDPSRQVGEIGLDSKKGDVSSQLSPFTEQIDLASELGRVASVHMTGAEKQVLEVLRGHGKGCRGIILHSFSSESYAKPFAEIGCMFSVSPRILARSEEKVRRLLGAIPEDRLLLESDAPHQGRFFTGMEDFLRTVARIADRSPEDLSEQISGNLRRILG